MGIQSPNPFLREPLNEHDQFFLWLNEQFPETETPETSLAEQVASEYLALNQMPAVITPEHQPLPLPARLGANDEPVVQSANSQESQEIPELEPLAELAMLEHEPNRDYCCQRLSAIVDELMGRIIEDAPSPTREINQRRNQEGIANALNLWARTVTSSGLSTEIAVSRTLELLDLVNGLGETDISLDLEFSPQDLVGFWHQQLQTILENTDNLGERALYDRLHYQLLRAGLQFNAAEVQEDYISARNELATTAEAIQADLDSAPDAMARLARLRGVADIYRLLQADSEVGQDFQNSYEQAMNRLQVFLRSDSLPFETRVDAFYDTAVQVGRDGNEQEMIALLAELRSWAQGGMRLVENSAGNLNMQEGLALLHQARVVFERVGTPQERQNIERRLLSALENLEAHYDNFEIDLQESDLDAALDGELDLTEWMQGQYSISAQYAQIGQHERAVAALNRVRLVLNHRTQQMSSAEASLLQEQGQQLVRLAVSAFNNQRSVENAESPYTSFAITCMQDLEQLGGRFEGQTAVHFARFMQAMLEDRMGAAAEHYAALETVGRPEEPETTDDELVEIFPEQTEEPEPVQTDLYQQLAQSIWQPYLQLDGRQAAARSVYWARLGIEGHYQWNIQHLDTLITEAIADGCDQEEINTYRARQRQFISQHENMRNVWAGVGDLVLNQGMTTREAIARYCENNNCDEQEVYAQLQQVNPHIIDIIDVEGFDSPNTRAEAYGRIVEEIWRDDALEGQAIPMRYAMASWINANPQLPGLYPRSQRACVSAILSGDAQMRDFMDVIYQNEGAVTLQQRMASIEDNTAAYIGTMQALNEMFSIRGAIFMAALIPAVIVAPIAVEAFALRMGYAALAEAPVLIQGAGQLIGFGAMFTTLNALHIPMMMGYRAAQGERLSHSEMQTMLISNLAIFGAIAATNMATGLVARWLLGTTIPGLGFASAVAGMTWGESLAESRGWLPEQRLPNGQHIPLAVRLYTNTLRCIPLEGANAVGRGISRPIIDAMQRNARLRSQAAYRPENIARLGRAAELQASLARRSQALEAQREVARAEGRQPEGVSLEQEITAIRQDMRALEQVLTELASEGVAEADLLALRRQIRMILVSERGLELYQQARTGIDSLLASAGEFWANNPQLENVRGRVRRANQFLVGSPEEPLSNMQIARRMAAISTISLVMASGCNEISPEMSRVLWRAIPFDLLGGLGAFFLGLRMMSDGLTSGSQESLQRTMHWATADRIRGFLTGTGVTGGIQSSSATTSILVGLVGAGTINLLMALPVIFGANVGTTLTAWLMSGFGDFKLTDFALPILGAGAMFYMFANRSGNVGRIGQGFAGLGLLLLGLTSMSEGFKDRVVTEYLREMFAMLHTDTRMGMLAAIAISAIMTEVVQSSSATTGIIVSLREAGVIDYPTAAALAVGANVGTTITAVLASLPRGTSAAARKVALAHVMFNVLGGLAVWAIGPGHPRFAQEQVFPAVASLITAMRGSEFQFSTGQEVAAFHTFFNVVNSLVFLTVLRQYHAAVNWTYDHTFERLLQWRRGGEQPSLTGLSPTLYNNPAAALEVLQNANRNMASMTEGAFRDVQGSINDPISREATRSRLQGNEERADGILAEVREHSPLIVTRTNEQGRLLQARERYIDMIESVFDQLRHVSVALAHIEQGGNRIPDYLGRELMRIHELALENYQRLISQTLETTPNLAEVHVVRMELETLRERIIQIRDSHFDRVAENGQRAECSAQDLAAERVIRSDLLDIISSYDDMVGRLENIAEAIGRAHPDLLLETGLPSE
ncbi:MAG: Na/Pi symporter [Pseudomonadota bacterium]